MVDSTALRAAFARRLSAMYGTEVPAYNTLVDVAQEVNREVMARMGAGAERLGTIGRVTAERHGAIRVGTPAELAQVARIFGAMGMYPVGYYDLREAARSSVPVVSTAFRPVDEAELAANPFRVFTSMLVTGDRRFFGEDLERRLVAFLEARRLFPPRLLDLADRAEADGGLDDPAAAEFLTLATQAFELSREPVSRSWYAELERVSAVAADIGGVPSTHINHLTPRVLDIDALYARMGERGITMIDAIQGPPRWDGPDLLLRQTSFRALAEPRLFRKNDGRVVQDDLRVRFGEVEARGIAVTPAGRALYDDLAAELDETLAGQPVTAGERNAVAAKLWEGRVPRTEAELITGDLAYFTFHVLDPRPGSTPPADLATLLAEGWAGARPIVYEDFLPRSAAGIFQSNLTSDGAKDVTRTGADLDAEAMAGILGRPLHDPYELYASIRAESLARVRAELGLDREIVIP
ncbi:putative glyoxalase superfamily metalloenzyme YdcJ [Nonomuraea polychroma]|uniref:2-oxoadipate dioxygenase/decarboxylase n=1 Tax=Nonomuraea polychroma TaxID=46176 RepID=A0A438M0J7_9ACTN|nr:VOC family protein [Nonomuraea polychroma]RVX39018.1 putative glyoxalase superfamily metalloenzyme YdcJ [Nonomuraea polychroma]